MQGHTRFALKALVTLVLVANLKSVVAYGSRKLHQLPYFGFNPVALGDGLSVDAPGLVLKPVQALDIAASEYGYNGAHAQSTTYNYGGGYGATGYGDPFTFRYGSYYGYSSYGGGYGTGTMFGTYGTKYGFSSSFKEAGYAASGYGG